MNFCKWFKGNNGTCFQIFVGLAVLLGGLSVAVILIATKPAVPKKAIEPQPTLVETIVAKSAEQKVILSAYGSVQDWQKVSLRPEVGGLVIEQSPDLIVGGFFKKGDVMLKIDPRDYQSVIDQEKANVQKAEVELKLEKGRKIIAEKEWELLDPAIQASEIGEDLALRRPQLLEKESALAAAQSRLEKAKLDLERTVIQAPFNAVVLEESVDQGQVVNTQNPIATLVATDEFRILVSIPSSRLHWIDLPEQGSQGASATIYQTFSDGRSFKRKGYIARLLGDLDPIGRMVRLLVAFDDPISLKDENQDIPPLLLDTYVRVDIDGPILQDVFIVPRRAIRENNNIWVIDNGKLAVRDAHIIYQDEKSVTIDQGIQEGDSIITSSLPVPIPGMRVRDISEK